MKQLKFRVLGRKKKLIEFRFRDLERVDTGLFAYAPGLVCIDCDDTEHNVMLCAGMPDKKGKIIYEGDIVSYHVKNNYIFTDRYEVKFKAGHFMIEDPITEMHWDLWRVNLECEIIGNIYNNPRLLPKRKTKKEEGI